MIDAEVVALRAGNLSQRISQALGAVDGIIFEHHYVAEVAAGLELPQLAQLQLQLGVGVIPIVALGLQRDDPGRLGLDDEVGVVVQEAVDPESLPTRQVAMPPLHAVMVRHVIDQAPLKVTNVSRLSPQDAGLTSTTCGEASA